MAKAGRGSDQFPLRLPSGLRDRIKRKAEGNGRSMNEEIVRALEFAFPEPVSISARLEELQVLFTAMGKVRGYDTAVDILTEEILSVIEAAAEGRDPSIDEASISDLQKAVKSWHRAREKDLADRRKAVDEKYNSASEES
ncbi:Arc family DNA-binding protein [Rhizobium sp. N4311]|uniref:Arc family DNA-binding protein n=1 Tax=Rhizobium sp. N4311 TaxID=1703972 RepID=UPI000B9F570D|nr:Arc family DNA-binding protein [Rhizobium sp. N4311]OYD03941.1 hypothetical protein AMK08_CH101970 [Rhizobium sp. N4311]